jgi:gliding motility-associated-like protein
MKLIYVKMTKIKLIFLFTLFLFSIKNSAQSDCNDAIVVCGNAGFEGLKTRGIGKQELLDSNTCSSQENNSIWLKLSIRTAGTLGFILQPETNDINEDFDFFVFGPNASCDSIGQAIRCSTTNPAAVKQANNFTGMNSSNSDESEGPGANGNSFVNWLTVAAGDSYYIVIDRPIGSSNFSLQWNGTATFNEPPALNIPTGTSINLEKSDLSGNQSGTSTFDLTNNTAVLIASQTDVTISYHTNSNDAIINSNPILNTTTFTNTTNPQTIYTRITNTITKCFNWTSFSIKVSDAITFPKNKFEICDSNDANAMDGLSKFDLNDVSATIFNTQNISSITINYYLSKNDADSNSNPLQSPFTNTIPFEQSIFIKAYSNQSSVATQEIKLIVNQLPTSVNAYLTQCETGSNPDGLSLFNLNEANFKLTNNNTDLLTSFFANPSDAILNNNPLNPFYTNTSNPQTIAVRVSNSKTSCYAISTLTLNVNAISETIYTINPVCDDDGTEDGLHFFNLEEANIPISTTQTIAYYLSETDALLEQNKITQPLHYQNETPYNQFIFVRIEDANDCFGISKIKLQINKLPDIPTTATAIVCDNNPSYYVRLDAGIPDNLLGDFSYSWTKDGIDILNENKPTFDTNSIGEYAVTLKNNSNCTKTRTITVSASDIAQITNISIVDLSVDGTNKVTIAVTGKGEYEYSIDYPNGPFQQSNLFNSISSGIHEVYISDKNGCGIISKTIAVIGAPKFFTPNGDGYNDYWNVKGLNTDLNKNSILYIFDRYGKLVKQISPSGLGWDGTLNGIPLPADDYWYTAKLVDGRETKGHFSLKR